MKKYKYLFIALLTHLTMFITGMIDHPIRIILILFAGITAGGIARILTDLKNKNDSKI